MRGYNVTYTVLYSESVLANSPEEAADIVENNCPYDIDGYAYVVDIDSGEEWEM